MRALLFTKRLDKKGPHKGKGQAKQPLVWQRLYEINEPGGM